MKKKTHSSVPDALIGISRYVIVWAITLLGATVLHHAGWSLHGIDDSAMEPNLVQGDIVLVERFTYGIRLPYWGYRLSDGRPPQRGELVLVRHPHSPETLLLRRVVATPGEWVYGRGRETAWLEPEPRADLTDPELALDGISLSCDLRSHVLRTVDAPARWYATLRRPHSPVWRRPEDVPSTVLRWQLPASRILVGADCRSDPRDSANWGALPLDAVLGRVVAIAWSRDPAGGWPIASRRKRWLQRIAAATHLKETTPWTS